MKNNENNQKNDFHILADLKLNFCETSTYTVYTVYIQSHLVYLYIFENNVSRASFISSFIYTVYMIFFFFFFFFKQIFILFTHFYLI